MVEFGQIESIAGGLVLLVLVVAALWLIRAASRGRLLRCPETGGLAIVEVDARHTGHGESTLKSVGQCDLWPEKERCDQGCLAHHPETDRAFGQVDLQALKPIKRS
jgi:hypothetical protein